MVRLGQNKFPEHRSNLTFKKGCGIMSKRKVKKPNKHRVLVPFNTGTIVHPSKKGRTSYNRKDKNNDRTGEAES
jgi:hypothetical protein